MCCFSFILQMCLLGACKEGDAEKVMKLLQEVADFDFSKVW